jgi:hypothetical protein
MSSYLEGNYEPPEPGSAAARPRPPRPQSPPQAARPARPAGYPTDPTFTGQIYAIRAPLAPDRGPSADAAASPVIPAQRRPQPAPPPSAARPVPPAAAAHPGHRSRPRAGTGRRWALPVLVLVAGVLLLAAAAYLAAGG